MSFVDPSRPREQRLRVMQAARLRDSRGTSDVRIDDVSSRGLQASADRPPARGEFVTVSIGGRDLAGHVKWVRGRAFGLVLRERIDVQAVATGRVSASRAKRPASVPQAGPVSSRAFALQWLVLIIAALSAAFLLTRMLGIAL